MSKHSLRVKLTALALSAAAALSCSSCSFIVKDEDIASSQAAESASTDASGELSYTTDEEPETDSDTDIGEHYDYTNEDAEAFYSGGIFFVYQDDHWRSMEMFLGSSTSGSTYVSLLNELAANLDDDVTVYSLVAPTACEYYTPSNYSDDATSQHDVILNMGDTLVNVVNVDVYETLNNHNAEAIYSRTDHHWTALGAYYAAKVFAKAAGVDFADISEYEQVDIEDYVGSMTAFANSDGAATLESDPETFTYYRPSVTTVTEYYDYSWNYSYTGSLLEESYGASYLMFIQGDGNNVRIDCSPSAYEYDTDTLADDDGTYYTDESTDTTSDTSGDSTVSTDTVQTVSGGVTNGRRILVIKDSFGNAMIPFLTSSFEEIYVADVRYMESNLYTVIEEFGITDVLFLMNTFSAVGSNGENIQTLMTQ